MKSMDDKLAQAKRAHRRSREFTDAMRARRIERLREQFGRAA